MSRKYKIILNLALSMLLITISLSPTGCDKRLDATPVTTSARNTNVDFLVATDIHYLSPSLYDEGQAFRTYVSSGDGKLLNHTDDITESLVNDIRLNKPQALILSGDLTNNGEKKSHEDLAKKLNKIQALGTKVLVIPGNHDILNPWARSFKGDSQYKTDYITPEQFASIYGEFGYNGALTRDDKTLSYLAQITDGLWVLMLDTCKYNLNLTVGIPQTDGSVPPSTMKWISESAKMARSHGAKLIAVMHHNLMDHSDIASEDFTLGNNEEVIDLFKKEGIKLALSGHIHMQDIRSSHSSIYDIATSAFSVNPHQYGVLHYSPSDRKMTYHTQKVDVERWARDQRVHDDQLSHFSTFAQDFFASNSYDKAYSSLEGQPFTDAEKERMALLMSKINLAFFAGTVGKLGPEIVKSPDLKLWDKAPSQFLKSYIESMLRSTQDHNHLSISLD